MQLRKVKNQKQKITKLTLIIFNVFTLKLIMQINKQCTPSSGSSVQVALALEQPGQFFFLDWRLPSSEDLPLLPVPETLIVHIKLLELKKKNTKTKTKE